MASASITQSQVNDFIAQFGKDELLRLIINAGDINNIDNADDITRDEIAKVISARQSPVDVVLTDKQKLKAEKEAEKAEKLRIKAEKAAEKEAKKAEKEKLKAEKEAKKAEKEKLKAEKEAKKAEKEANKAEKEAKKADKKPVIKSDVDGVADGVEDGDADGVADGVEDSVADGVADGVAAGAGDGVDGNKYDIMIIHDDNHSHNTTTLHTNAFVHSPNSDSDSD